MYNKQPKQMRKRVRLCRGSGTEQDVLNHQRIICQMMRKLCDCIYRTGSARKLLLGLCVCVCSGGCAVSQVEPNRKHKR